MDLNQIKNSHEYVLEQYNLIDKHIETYRHERTFNLEKFQKMRFKAEVNASTLKRIISLCKEVENAIP